MYKLFTIYIKDLQDIKDTTDTQRSASYLDLHLEIDNYIPFLSYTVTIEQLQYRQFSSLNQKLRK